MVGQPGWAALAGLVGQPWPAWPCCAPAVDHVVAEPGGSLAEALERWREWADGKACCDYALHVDIPRWSDHIRQELHTMVQEKGALPATPCLSLAREGKRWLRCQVPARSCTAASGSCAPQDCWWGGWPEQAA